VDWKIFATTFVTIFLAEFGDKTQFAALAASASTNSFWSVLLGVVLALACAGAMGVLVGHFIGGLVNPRWIHTAAGVLFILVGIWVLLDRA